MRYDVLPGGICRVENDTDAPLIASAQDALDLLATVKYEQGCAKLVLDKADIAEALFDLRTGLAGEVFQKFVNYGGQIAIVGDFSGYTSRALRDFIRESNRGHTAFFVPTVAEAVQKLQ